MVSSLPSLPPTFIPPTCNLEVDLKIPSSSSLPQPTTFSSQHESLARASSDLIPADTQSLFKPHDISTFRVHSTVNVHPMVTRSKSAAILPIGTTKTTVSIADYKSAVSCKTNTTTAPTGDSYPTGVTIVESPSTVGVTAVDIPSAVPTTANIMNTESLVLVLSFIYVWSMEKMLIDVELEKMLIDVELEMHWCIPKEIENVWCCTSESADVCCLLLGCLKNMGLMCRGEYVVLMTNKCCKCVVENMENMLRGLLLSCLAKTVRMQSKRPTKIGDAHSKDTQQSTLRGNVDHAKIRLVG
ncbi:hypothetical protein Patl1_19741 [Pistacia atlantica]|uniref:Uncharacterized protein n=1 Tax=Pistacia atlantica TaxID=434234 RepID=A0ACC1C2L8_9ROSI|nr:hypothetical protein Patl1_19741 [Pistacia atlantica]